MGTFLWAYIGQRHYLPTQAADEMSTAKHTTSGFPPTYINVGDDDLLESQAYELEAILRRQGVPVTSRYWTWSGRNCSATISSMSKPSPGSWPSRT